MRLGLGWRHALAHEISRRPELSFVELLAEDIDLSRPLPRALEQLRERGCEIVVHSVSLSLGSAEGPDLEATEHLARVAERLGARRVSEHISFTRSGGLDSGHLLPLPRTQRAIEVFAENVARVKPILGVPLALENIASFVQWPSSELSEAEFVHRVLDATGCELLLDLSNLYANAVNFGVSPADALREMPLTRIAYCHIAGGTLKGGLYHDTHAHPVREGPLAVLRELAKLRADVDVLLERDDHFPKSDELEAELSAITAAATTGDSTSEVEALVTGGEECSRSTEVQPALDDQAAVTALIGFTNAPPTPPSSCEESETPRAAHRTSGAESKTRTALHAAQLELLSSLMHSSPPPLGFDTERVKALGHTLANKRMRTAKRLWPALARQLGGEFETAFARHVAPLPMTRHRPALTDGFLLATRLEDSLNAAAAAELSAVRLRYRLKSTGLAPKRFGATAMKTENGERLFGVNVFSRVLIRSA